MVHTSPKELVQIDPKSFASFDVNNSQPPLKKDDSLFDLAALCLAGDRHYWKTTHTCTVSIAYINGKSTAEVYYLNCPQCSTQWSQRRCRIPWWMVEKITILVNHCMMRTSKNACWQVFLKGMMDMLQRAMLISCSCCRRGFPFGVSNRRPRLKSPGKEAWPNTPQENFLRPFT